MSAVARRHFLASAGAAIGGLAAARVVSAHPDALQPRIGRENLKITDIQVTLLSRPLPPDKQWMTGTMDAILAGEVSRGAVWLNDGAGYFTASDQQFGPQRTWGVCIVLLTH